MAHAAVPRMSVGVDTVQVSDVLDSIRTFGERYLNRVFTAHEQDSCSGPDDIRARGLAARFAAKEAVYKALRPGDLPGPWTAIEIRRNVDGASDVALHGAAAQLADRTRVRDICVSMTHEGDSATAFAVALRDDRCAPRPDPTVDEAPARELEI